MMAVAETTMPVVAAARAVRAILVTNDAHLLALDGHEGLKVVRPINLRAH